MSTAYGALPSSPSELGRVEDRISFIYLEHAVIARDANALTATTEDGVLHIPSAGLLVLLLGPGTNVTHQAMVVLADSGAAIVWVGEHGVRFYAGGRPLARSTRFLEKQAAIISNSRRRVALARRMYKMRFPGESTEKLTMQQLRGREGARVRNVYRQSSEKTGVAWERRDYDAEDFESSDQINQALSAANACLYGVVHAAIVALGCSPGLGIIHTGHDRSFVYDIADLYKAETSIPIAFEVVAELTGNTEDVDIQLSTMIRRRMRDTFIKVKLIDRIIADIKKLLTEENDDDDDDIQASDGENLLWDTSGNVEGGTNYAGETTP